MSMKFGFDTRHALLLGTLGLCACGSGPISVDGSDAGETDAGETDAGETDAGETDTLACISDGGLGPGVLRLEPNSNRAWLIDAGVELELELELDAPGTAPYLVGATAGQRVAIARSTGTFGDQDSTVHAFARGSGELLWIREIGGVGVSQLWAGDDGWLAGSLSPSIPGARVGFVMSDAQAVMLTEHEPLAAPANGWLAAAELDGDGIPHDLGWLELGADEQQGWVAVEPAPTNSDVSVADDDHTLEYLALVDGAQMFVQARPGQAKLIGLPIALQQDESLALTQSAGRYRVVQRYSAADQSVVSMRIDVDAGVAVLVAPEPPVGWSYFDCYSRKASLDADGVMFFELRDDASARLWAYDVEAATWSEAGLGLGLVDDMDVIAHGKHVQVVHAMAQFTTFCPPSEWSDPPADALVGDSLQLFRRDPQLSVALPPATWQVLVDPHERCAAYLGEQGWEVMALDGDNHTLALGPGIGSLLWLD